MQLKRIGLLREADELREQLEARGVSPAKARPEKEVVAFNRPSIGLQ